MKIIKPSVSYIDKRGMTPYQFIEKIGRTCYKSEDKITEDSSLSFVKSLCIANHLAMIEHYWVHLIVTKDICYALTELGLDSVKRYMHFTILEDGLTFVSCPLRVFFDHIHIMEELNNPYIETVQDMWQCVINSFSDIFGLKVAPTKYSELVEENEFCNRLRHYLEELDGSKENIDNELMKHKTHTLHFVCDRGVTHELVRHRPCSFAQESQRYCNYGLNKFSKEITFIEPLFFHRWREDMPNCQTEEYFLWQSACEFAEQRYFKLLELGKKPQEARTVLPNSTKTEIIITTNELEWKHILNLRLKGTTGAPHPQMLEVMTIAYELLLKESEGRLSLQ